MPDERPEEKKEKPPEAQEPQAVSPVAQQQYADRDAVRKDDRDARRENDERKEKGASATLPGLVLITDGRDGGKRKDGGEGEGEGKDKKGEGKDKKGDGKEKEGDGKSAARGGGDERSGEKSDKSAVRSFTKNSDTDGKAQADSGSHAKFLDKLAEIPKAVSDLAKGYGKAATEALGSLLKDVQRALEPSVDKNSQEQVKAATADIATAKNPKELAQAVTRLMDMAQLDKNPFAAWNVANLTDSPDRLMRTARQVANGKEASPEAVKELMTVQEKAAGLAKPSAGSESPRGQENKDGKKDGRDRPEEKKTQDTKPGLELDEAGKARKELVDHIKNGSFGDLAKAVELYKKADSADGSIYFMDKVNDDLKQAGSKYRLDEVSTRRDPNYHFMLVDRSTRETTAHLDVPKSSKSDKTSEQPKSGMSAQEKLAKEIGQDVVKAVKNPEEFSKALERLSQAAEKDPKGKAAEHLKTIMEGTDKPGLSASERFKIQRENAEKKLAAKVIDVDPAVVRRNQDGTIKGEFSVGENGTVKYDNGEGKREYHRPDGTKAIYSGGLRLETDKKGETTAQVWTGEEWQKAKEVKDKDGKVAGYAADLDPSKNSGRDRVTVSAENPSVQVFHNKETGNTAVIDWSKNKQTLFDSDNKEIGAFEMDSKGEWQEEKRAQKPSAKMPAEQAERPKDKEHQSKVEKPAEKPGEKPAEKPTIDYFPLAMQLAVQANPSEQKPEAKPASDKKADLEPLSAELMKKAASGDVDSIKRMVDMAVLPGVERSQARDAKAVLAEIAGQPETQVKVAQALLDAYKKDDGNRGAVLETLGKMPLSYRFYFGVDQASHDIAKQAADTIRAGLTSQSEEERRGALAGIMAKGGFDDSDKRAIVGAATGQHSREVIDQLKKMPNDYTKGQVMLALTNKMLDGNAQVSEKSAAANALLEVGGQAAILENPHLVVKRQENEKGAVGASQNSKFIVGNVSNEFTFSQKDGELRLENAVALNKVYLESAFRDFPTDVAGHRYVGTTDTSGKTTWKFQDEKGKDQESPLPIKDVSVAPNGRVLVTYENNAKVEFDEKNRARREIFPDKSERVYDESGKLKSKTDAPRTDDGKAVESAPAHERALMAARRLSEATSPDSSPARAAEAFGRLEKLAKSGDKEAKNILDSMHTGGAYNTLASDRHSLSDKYAAMKEINAALQAPLAEATRNHSVSVALKSLQSQQVENVQKSVDVLVENSPASANAHAGLGLILAAGTDKKSIDRLNAQNEAKPKDERAVPDLKSLSPQQLTEAKIKAAEQLARETGQNGGALSKSDATAVAGALAHVKASGDKSAASEKLAAQLEKTLELALNGKGRQNALDGMAAAIKDGAPGSEKLLGMYLKHGDKQDATKVLTVITQQAAEGNSTATNMLGSLVVAGLQKDQSNEALKTLTNLAESGKGKEAAAALGLIAATGPAEPARQATEALSKIAEKGDVDAVEALGSAASRGWPDHAKGAREALEKLAKSGNTDAAAVLGALKKGEPEAPKAQLERNADGKIEIRTEQGKLVLNNDSSGVMKDGKGKTVGSIDVAGNRYLMQEADGKQTLTIQLAPKDGQGKPTFLHYERVGDNQWLGLGPDGSKVALQGEFKLREDGSLSFKSQDKEIIRKLDGSVVTADARGNVQEVQDRHGQVTRFKYTDGSLSRVENPDGSSWQKMGNDLWIKEGTAEVSRAARNVDKNGVLHIEEGDKKISVGTDGWERHDDGKGKVSFERHNPDGSTIRKNDKDQITSISDKHGNTFKFEYGADGQPEKMIKPSGEVVSAKDGKTQILVDENFSIHEVSQGKEVVYNPNGLKVEYANGRAVALTAGKDTYKYGYDYYGNLNSVTYPSGVSWRSDDGKNWTKYDANGKKTDKTWEGAMNIRGDGGYDELSAKSGEKRSLDVNLNWITSKDGRLLSVEKADGSITKHLYDANHDNKFYGTETKFKDGSAVSQDQYGRVTAIKDTAGHETRYRYQEGDKQPHLIETKEGLWHRQGKDENGKDVWVLPGGGSEPATFAGTIMPRPDGTEHRQSAYSVDSAFRNRDGTRVEQHYLAVKVFDAQNRLTATINAKGEPGSYGYGEITTPNGVKLKGQLNHIKEMGADGKAEEWNTKDGWEWTRKGDGAKSFGVKSIDKDGQRVDLSDKGVETRRDLGGGAPKVEMQERLLRKADAVSALLHGNFLDSTNVSTVMKSLNDPQRADKIDKMLSDLTADEVKVVDAIIKANNKGRGIAELTRDTTHGVPNYEQRVTRHLTRTDNEDFAGQLHAAITERNNIFFGRENERIEEFVRQLVSKSNSQEIAKVRADYEARFGKSLESALSEMPQSSFTRAFVETYKNGTDKASAEQQKELLDLATKLHNLPAFKEMVNIATPAAIDMFKKDNLDAKMREISYVGGSLFSGSGYSRAREAQARLVLSGQSDSTAERIKSHSHLLSSDVESVVKILDEMKPDQHERFREGEQLVKSGKADLNAEEKQAVKEYRDIVKALDSTFSDGGKYRRAMDHARFGKDSPLEFVRGSEQFQNEAGMHAHVRNMNFEVFKNMANSHKFLHEQRTQLYKDEPTGIGNNYLHNIDKELTAVHKQVSDLANASPAKLRELPQFQKMSSQDFEQFQKGQQIYKEIANARNDRAVAKIVERVGSSEEQSKALEAFHKAAFQNMRGGDSPLTRLNLELREMAAQDKGWREIAMTVERHVKENPELMQGENRAKTLAAMENFSRDRGDAEMFNGMIKPLLEGRAWSPDDLLSFHGTKTKVIGYGDSMVGTHAVTGDQERHRLMSSASREELVKHLLDLDDRKVERLKNSSPEQRQKLLEEMHRPATARLHEHGDIKQRELVEQILKEGKVGPEERLRAYVVSGAVTKEEVTAMLDKMSPEERGKAIEAYSKKYKSEALKDVFDKVKPEERAEMSRLLTGREISSNEAFAKVASDNSKRSSLQEGLLDVAGYGGTVADVDVSMRDFHRNMVQAAQRFEQLPPEKQQELVKAFENAMKNVAGAERELADKMFEYGMVALGATAGFASGGTLTPILMAGVAGMSLKLGTHYLMLGNNADLDPASLLRMGTAGFLHGAGTAVTPEHFAALFNVGGKAAARTSELLAAEFKLSSEVRTQAQAKLTAMMREKIQHGVTDFEKAELTKLAKDLGIKDIEKFARVAKDTLRTEVGEASKSFVREATQQFLAINREVAAGTTMVALSTAASAVESGKLPDAHALGGEILSGGVLLPLKFRASTHGMRELTAGASHGTGQAFMKFAGEGVALAVAARVGSAEGGLIDMQLLAQHIGAAGAHNLREGMSAARKARTGSEHSDVAKQEARPETAKPETKPAAPIEQKPAADGNVGRAVWKEQAKVGESGTPIEESRAKPKSEQQPARWQEKRETVPKDLQSSEDIAAHLEKKVPVDHPDRAEAQIRELERLERFGNSTVREAVQSFKQEALHKEKIHNAEIHDEIRTRRLSAGDLRPGEIEGVIKEKEALYKVTGEPANWKQTKEGLLLLEYERSRAAARAGTPSGDVYHDVGMHKGKDPFDGLRGILTDGQITGKTDKGAQVSQNAGPTNWIESQVTIRLRATPEDLRQQRVGRDNQIANQRVNWFGTPGTPIDISGKPVEVIVNGKSLAEIQARMERVNAAVEKANADRVAKGLQPLDVKVTSIGEFLAKERFPELAQALPENARKTFINEMAKSPLEAQKAVGEIASQMTPQEFRKLLESRPEKQQWAMELLKEDRGLGRQGAEHVDKYMQSRSLAEQIQIREKLANENTRGKELARVMEETQSFMRGKEGREGDHPARKMEAAFRESGSSTEQLTPGGEKIRELAEAVDNAKTPAEKRKAEDALKSEVVTQAKELAKRMGLPPEIVDHGVIKLASKPNEMGSYDSTDHHISLDPRSGDPITTLFHEMKHMSKFIKKSALAKAAPETFKMLIQESVLVNVGTEGKRYESDGNPHKRTKLSPEGQEIAREALRDLMNRRDQNVEKYLEKLKSNDPAKYNKLMEDFGGGKGAKENAVKELKGELDHYKVVKALSKIWSEARKPQEVMPGDSKEIKAEKEAHNHRAKILDAEIHRQRLLYEGAKQRWGSDLANHPEMLRETRGFASAVTGLKSGADYARSTEEFSPRRYASSETLRAWVKEMSRYLDAGQGLSALKELKVGLDTVKAGETSAAKEIKMQNQLERIVSAYEKSRTAKDSIGREIALEQARTEAHKLLEGLDPTHRHAGVIIKGLVQTGLVAREAIPKNMRSLVFQEQTFTAALVNRFASMWRQDSAAPASVEGKAEPKRKSKAPTPPDGLSPELNHTLEQIKQKTARDGTTRRLNKLSDEQINTLNKVSEGLLSMEQRLVLKFVATAKIEDVQTLLNMFEASGSRKSSLVGELAAMSPEAVKRTLDRFESRSKNHLSDAPAATGQKTAVERVQNLNPESKALFDLDTLTKEGKLETPEGSVRLQQAERVNEAQKLLKRLATEEKASTSHFDKAMSAPQAANFVVDYERVAAEFLKAAAQDVRGALARSDSEGNAIGIKDPVLADAAVKLLRQVEDPVITVPLKYWEAAQKKGFIEAGMTWDRQEVLRGTLGIDPYLESDEPRVALRVKKEAEADPVYSGPRTSFSGVVQFRGRTIPINQLYIDR